MELDYSKLAKGFPKPTQRVYLFLGSDDALKREALKRLTEPLLEASFADFDREERDIPPTGAGEAGEAARAILASAGGVPMASERRVVIVTNVHRLGKEDQDVLAAGVAKLGDLSCLVLVTGATEYDAGKVKARTTVGTKLVTAVAKAGATVLCDAPGESGLQARAQALLKERGKTMEPAALALIMDRAKATAAERGGGGRTGDLHVLRNEMEKAIAHAGDRAQVTKADAVAVGRHTVQDNIFTLLDAVGHRDPRRALAEADNLLDAGDKPDAVAARTFVMLARHLRQVWGAKYLADQRLNGFNLKGSLPPEVQAVLSGEMLGITQRQSYRLKDLQEQARGWTYPALRDGLTRVLASDLAMKSIPGGAALKATAPADDPASNLRLLVVELCRVGLLCLLLLALCLPAGPVCAQAALPPTVALPGGVTRLEDVGLYGVTYRYDDGRTGALPLGWTGDFTEDTGIACRPEGTQTGRAAFLLHPPWKGGTGETDQTFRLALPRAAKILLSFAVALAPWATGPDKSDGVVFRVFLNDKPLLDQRKADSAWAVSQFDLTAHAGQTVTLRFETDPGPTRIPSFDFALWGDRAITVTGAPASARTKRAMPEWTGAASAVSAWGGVSPTYLPALAGHFQPRVQVSAKAADFLDGWTLTVPGQSRPLGLGNGAYLELVGPDGKTVRSDGPGVARTMTQETRANGAVCRQWRYQVGTRTVSVTADLFPPRGGCARVDVHSDDPYIAAIHFGDIGPVAFRKTVIVPYLGTVQYLSDLGLFSHVFLDHTRSQASELDDATARYGPLTDGRRNAVQETAYFAVSPDVHSVLPTPANPPSPFRRLLGDKVVLDVWGGAFTDNAARLREYESYGLTHFLIIAHSWQNGGYDNKLPDVLPAQAELGGDEGMWDWASAGTDGADLFALHENYVDFYPNAASYDENDVARQSDGHLVPAWKNLIQSYAVAPTAILKYARKITPEVHDRYGTTAGYLDVHSAVPPWFHVDFRADQPGAGKFQTVWNAHRDLWTLFRQTHGGPVLGEGANHWYWSGLLDGVEAQFGAGVPSNGGETAPLFVDFDLLKIHPLQFNHGMGYLERWYVASSHPDWEEGLPPLKTLDQYRMQEIAYGHAGFAAALLWSRLPFVWQESGLVRPVTRRYATARAVAIDYDIAGQWRGANAALAQGLALDRVRVRYDTGLTVWANSRAQDLKVAAPSETLTLPQYGWLAQGDGLLAYTAWRDGVVADYAETPDSIFADARTTNPAPKPRLRVTPGVSQFAQTGPRRFRLTFAWEVGEAVPAGYTPFVHVTGTGGTAAEDIVFQLGSGLAAAPDTWAVGLKTVGDSVEATLPETLRDGVYAIKVGLYRSLGGDRLRLTGQDDGSRRFVVGLLTVTDAGQTLRWQPPSVPSAPLSRERAEHANPSRKLIHFGKLATDGSVSLERLGPGVWRLMPFPRDQPFTVAVNAARIDPKLLPLQVQALSDQGTPLGRLPLLSLPLGWAQFRVNTVPRATAYLLTGSR